MEAHPEILQQELCRGSESCINFGGDLFFFVKLPTLFPKKSLNSELKPDDQMFGHGQISQQWVIRSCTLL